MCSPDFNPRSPCGERQSPQTLPCRCRISIHAPHAGSDHIQGTSGHVGQISIHAPHAGSDHLHGLIASHIFDFNPRSPCGERPIFDYIYMSTHYFNPRSPCGERHKMEGENKDATNFNPRSPCGERLKLSTGMFDDENFNPRSPCGERLQGTGEVSSRQIFQSTLPMRGSTEGTQAAAAMQKISIHAPHAGSDKSKINTTWRNNDFNPRSPCGERLYNHGSGQRRTGFQSTLPMRGATIIACIKIPN